MCDMCADSAINRLFYTHTIIRYHSYIKNLYDSKIELEVKRKKKEEKILT